MTQKELLYLEDAINHETSIIQICEITIANLPDESLKAFVDQELNIHKELKQKLLTLMEEKTNE